MLKNFRSILSVSLLVLALASCQQAPNPPLIIPDSSSISKVEAIEAVGIAFNSLNQNAIQDDVVAAIKHFAGDSNFPNNPNISRVANTTFINMKGTEYPVEILDGLKEVASDFSSTLTGWAAGWAIAALFGSEVPFYIPVDELAISMETSIEFDNYTDCFWEWGSAESILDGQINVVGTIDEAILDKSVLSIVDNDKDVTASIFGTYEISIDDASPLQILMNDESKSRYDLSFSGLEGSFKLTANIDASKLGLSKIVSDLGSGNYGEVVAMVADAVKSWDIIVYVPETDSNFSASVIDPETGDSQVLSWSEASYEFDDSTNKLDNDELSAAIEAYKEFTDNLGSSSFGTVRFFNSLDNAIKGNGSYTSQDYGTMDIANFGTLGISEGELDFELSFDDYKFSADSDATAVGSANITFIGTSDSSSFSATSYEANVSANLSTGEAISFSVSGAIANNSGNIVFTLDSEKVSGIQDANGGNQSSLQGAFDNAGITAIEGIDINLLF